MTTHRTGITRQVAPLGAVGLLIIAASAAHAAASATGDPTGTALTVAVVAFVVAVLVAMKRGRRIECPKARARLTAFLTGSAVWLGAVTSVGISWGAVEILALMVGALSLHWWRVHRIPNPDVVTVAADDDALTLYADRWADNIGETGCLLPRTKLVRGERIDAGVRYALMMVPGKHERASVTGNLEKIRGGLGLREEQDFIVEKHPTLSQPHQLVTIVTRSPIKEEVIWPGPAAFDPKTGSVALGPFADGMGVAHWRVYAGPRIKGGYMQGGTGSGKSRTFDAVAIAVAAAESHPTVVAYADGQGGASSPMLAEHADVVARTPEEFREMLSGLLRVKELRQLENDLERWTGFTPRADRPGILVFVDEQHKFFCDPVIAAMAAELVREGEKVGIAIIGASQDPLLSAFGGSGAGNNAETLRSNMLMGNGLVFASKAKDVKQVFGIDIDPSSFPPTPGYAYVVSPVPGARSAPYRNYHFTDAQALVIPQRIMWRELDAGAANAYGPAYRNRRELAARALEAKRAKVEAMRNGAPAPAEREEVSVTRTVPAFTTPTPDVAQFPVWHSTPVASHPVDAARVADIHRRAAAAIAEGHAMKNGFTMPSLLAKHLSCSPRWAHDALHRLMELGVVRPGDKQGQYYPTGKKLESAA